jgi:hypothetical protein
MSLRRAVLEMSGVLFINDVTAKKGEKERSKRKKR